MKIKVPEYFIKFRCIADKCKDSCCIGWEIVIDDLTRKKYSRITGEIGREIAEKTQHGCFPLRENGRCTFLDDKGLCRIISALGDGYLCDICREHPRYYGVGKDEIEGGLGLGCEEAARMILSLKELPKIIELEREVSYEDNDDLAEVSEHFKDLLTSGIFTSDAVELISRYKACSKVADDVAFEASTTRMSVSIPKVTYALLKNDEINTLHREFISLLEGCEYMNDEWSELLEPAKDVETERLIDGLNNAKGLLYYFTHRYVREGAEDMSLGQRILFALLSTLAVVAIAEVMNSNDPLLRAAVLFSKNIEYSTDNVDMILDALSEVL